MKVIILAAGVGSRLRPLTDKFPKCMVEVNGVKIIDKQINNLLQNGIKEEQITVVTGYKSELLKSYINNKYANISIIVNKDYEITNNMYSLYLASNIWKNEDCILMNADVFYDSNVIKDLLSNANTDMIVCDNGRYIEESMKIVKQNERIMSISKQIAEEDSYGVTIDVYKISSEATNKLYDIIFRIINVEKNLNSWTEVALNELLKSHEFKSLDMKYNWVEIDNHEDLKIAEELF